VPNGAALFPGGRGIEPSRALLGIDARPLASSIHQHPLGWTTNSSCPGIAVTRGKISGEGFLHQSAHQLGQITISGEPQPHLLVHASGAQLHPVVAFQH
jgi:hypothetical protein